MVGYLVTSKERCSLVAVDPDYTKLNAIKAKIARLRILDE